MAGKVRVNGTNYSITGGKCRVNGTNYAIKKGRALVGGTGYDITFSSVILSATCRIYVANESDEYEVVIYVNGSFRTRIYGNDGTAQAVEISASKEDEVMFSVSRISGIENISISTRGLQGCSILQTTDTSVTLKIDANEAIANITFDIYN